MRNYITEISEQDFKKLNLVGYDNERVEIDENSYELKFIKKNLNDKLEEYKQYLAETIIKDKINLPWVMAVCIHTEPDPLYVDYMKLTTVSATGKNDLTDAEAFNLSLYDYSYYDKWMDKAGHKTYEFGIGLDHLYSTRDKWLAKGWIDYFEVRKKDTQAVYIIHLEGKPEDYIKNATN
jgi:hypothetical protein